MRILDTGILTAFLKGDPEAKRYMDSTDDSLATTTINYYEIHYTTKGLKEKRRKQALDIFLNIYVYPLEIEDARPASEIASDLSKEGKAIGTLDTMIAGIAKNKGCILVTRDRHFERVADIKIERW